MARWFHARTIVEEPSASESADRLGQQFPRFEESYEALQWLLARADSDFVGAKRVVGDKEYCLYRQAGDILANTPEITVVFTFDNDEVVIVDIKAEALERA